MKTLRYIEKIYRWFKNFAITTLITFQHEGCERSRGNIVQKFRKLGRASRIFHLSRLRFGNLFLTHTSLLTIMWRLVKVARKTCFSSTKSPPNLYLDSRRNFITSAFIFSWPHFFLCPLIVLLIIHYFSF